jgi:hypothetical protein
MNSSRTQAAVEIVPVIAQLRQALDGDKAALTAVIGNIRSTPENFIEEFQRAVLAGSASHADAGNRNRAESRELPSRLSEEESVLLRKINAGLPEGTWDRYHALRDKLEAETLTNDEHREQICLSDEIETTHAKRLSLVWELAKLRGKTLEQVMAELGLVSPGVRSTSDIREDQGGDHDSCIMLNREGVVNLRRLLVEAGVHPTGDT